MTKKPKYIAEGKDFSGGKFINADLEFSLPATPTNPGPVKGSGKPISLAAFTELKNRYTTVKSKSDTEWVTFSREALLTVLAQNDCAGIKFYFVNRIDTTKNQLTLTMAGVDDSNNDLNALEAATTTQSTLLTEEGNGWPPTE